MEIEYPENNNMRKTFFFIWSFECLTALMIGDQEYGESEKDP